VVRSGVVGVLNNLLGYVIYLLMTFFGLDPKIAVTILYPVSVATGYFGHFKYSFSYRKGHAGTLLRYGLAHCAGYGVNVAMHFVFTDRLGFPHQAVQAAAILVVAGLLFMLFRYFVFPNADSPAAR
jgi:putative flippase GtrA